MNFLILFFAHLVGDYPLQGDFLAKTKGQNYISLISHAGIWTGTMCVALLLMGAEVTLFDVAWLFVVHAAADRMKAAQLSFHKKLNPLGLGLLIDQGIHVLQILILMAYKGL